VTTYKTYDVLELQPAARDRVVSFTQTKSRLDSNAGRLDERAILNPTPIGQRSFVYVADGRANIAALKTFIAARKGKQVPVWVPTWTRDFLPTATATAGATTLVVSGTRYSTLIGPLTDFGRDHLALLHPNGTFQYRGISASTASGVVETLTLASSLTLAVTPNVTLVSYLTLCRLDTDDVSITWYNPDYAEATLRFQELPRETPAP
jgi:hypothetical protein